MIAELPLQIATGNEQRSSYLKSKPDCLFSDQSSFVRQVCSAVIVSSNPETKKEQDSRKKRDSQKKNLSEADLLEKERLSLIGKVRRLKGGEINVK